MAASLYQQSLDWLYSTQWFGIKLGLENVTRLLDACGIPPRLSDRKIIHVAGTNGKGSVCAFSEQILRDAGLKTGLFTSPHLIEFSERIRVNGVSAPRDALGALIDRIRRLIDGWDPHPTFFEITLAAALWHFCEESCDVIVLETGMGGRLDATNAIRADVSVITQISLDHQQWLGETIAAIAAEKAGILKPGVPAIVADLCPEAREVVGRRALELGIPLIEAHPLSPDWELGLAGDHQRENASLAVEAACRIEDGKLTLDGIRKSLARTSWPARFQRIDDQMIIDGAHNEGAARCLAAAWNTIFGDAVATLIFGAVKTKDIHGIFAQLAPIAARIILVPVKSERRLDAEEMKTALAEAGFGHVETRCLDSLGEAIALARSFPEKILLTGSLYLAGEALSILQGKLFEVSSQ